MPELPEVETTVNAISGNLKKRKIKSLKVYQPELRYPFKNSWRKKIVGQRITKVKRRGKYIIIELQSGALIIHLGMTGKLFFTKPYEPLKKHDHFDLDVGQFNLRYNDPRRFGFVDIVPLKNLAEYPSLAALGPEPLSNAFNASALRQKINKKKSPSRNLEIRLPEPVDLGGGHFASFAVRLR